MRNIVVYLISGPDHLPNLVVSLNSLRRHGWDGEVWVFAWKESADIVKQISEDRGLDIRVLLRRPQYRGKNAQFLDKIRVVGDMGICDRVLYLDADTLPVGNVRGLFDQAAECSFLATQFNDWTTGTGGVVDKRIRKLLDYPEIPQYLIQELLAERWTSVNGGVFVANPKSSILDDWEKWTNLCKETVFIADEAVLHVVMAHHFNQGLSVSRGGVWNASPKFNKLPDCEVKLWHFHGDCNLRPAKSPKGVSIWWPEYMLCLNENVGKIEEWQGSIGGYFQKALQYPDIMEECKSDAEISQADAAAGQTTAP